MTAREPSTGVTSTGPLTDREYIHKIIQQAQANHGHLAIRTKSFHEGTIDFVSVAEIDPDLWNAMRSEPRDAMESDPAVEHGVTKAYTCETPHVRNTALFANPKVWMLPIEESLFRDGGAE